MAERSDPSPTPARAPRIFVVAGEPSGDIHTGHLLRELGRLLPGAATFGFGGKNMRESGFRTMIDLPSQAIMGLFPVLLALPKIKGWFRTAEAALETERPDFCLLVDYPGFNLRFARRANRRGIPVVWFISPQVWAWNKKRIRKIAAVVDLMLVILPFEKDVYRETGMETHYVGHPLTDHIEETKKRRGRPLPELSDRKEKTIGIFPGSRRHVVHALWPVFRETIGVLAARSAPDELTFVVAAADENLRAVIDALPAPKNIDVRVVTGHAHEVMEASDACLTTSGTTTLEIALHRKPMVLAYRVSRALWTIGRMVVSVPHIGLVNLIAEKGIVPEHVGPALSPAAIAGDLLPLLQESPERARMLEGLDLVQSRLDTPGAYRRAAEVIRSWWSKRPHRA